MWRERGWLFVPPEEVRCWDPEPEPEPEPDLDPVPWLMPLLPLIWPIPSCSYKPPCCALFPGIFPRGRCALN